MSQGRGQRIGLRAIFAIAAVCALVFSLLVSGAPHVSRGFATTHASSRGDVRPAVCHDYVVDASEGATPDGGGRKKRAECPCCLAAHAGPAVLPERTATLTRLAPTATPAVYRAPTHALPRFSLLQTVNGARAPPSRDTLS